MRIRVIIVYHYVTGAARFNIYFHFHLKRENGPSSDKFGSLNKLPVSRSILPLLKSLTWEALILSASL